MSSLVSFHCLSSVSGTDELIDVGAIGVQFLAGISAEGKGSTKGESDAKSASRAYHGLICLLGSLSKEHEGLVLLFALRFSRAA